MKAANLENLAVQKVLTALDPILSPSEGERVDLILTCNVLKRVKKSLQTRIYVMDQRQNTERVRLSRKFSKISF